MLKHTANEFCGDILIDDPICGERSDESALIIGSFSISATLSGLKIKLSLFKTIKFYKKPVETALGELIPRSDRVSVASIRSISHH